MEARDPAPLAGRVCVGCVPVRQVRGGHLPAHPQSCLAVPRQNGSLHSYRPPYCRGLLRRKRKYRGVQITPFHSEEPLLASKTCLFA
ncbi:hypothetical protein NDU88_000562 [Pleurodeles waltl]|uniref:Uncharacterized protein n=1 Tax=Pleurodeles waltl TaxID=8319 RepID=A0AAV7KTR7_PLEWA|nr:hypothetical protein NDU88_000562 [Pleurodeles waltl]